MLKWWNMKFDRKELFTIPNILTYIRIICVPFFIWLMLDKSIPNNVYIAFGLFLFASVTDMVDGYVARHYNLISDIGKVIDPVADKMLQVSTLLCLTIIGNIHWAFPLVFFLKELYMILGGIAIIKIMKSDYIIQSNFFGKGATWLNSLGIVMGFFVKQGNRAYDISVYVILSIGAVFAVITAIIYTVEFVKFRKKENVERNKNVALAIGEENIAEELTDKNQANEIEEVNAEIVEGDNATQINEQEEA